MRTFIGKFSKNTSVIFIFVLATLISHKAESANNIEFLSESVIKDLQLSVFEVVVPKKESDKIKYSKKLPFHTLSFKERNEKFYSVGTAFFINTKELMSASHVFNLEYFTLFNDFYIRDKKGAVYKINKINKYDTVRDMIVFELESYPKKFTPLSFTNDTEIGDTVFSVGNAQGEGVSFRAGQVASYTLESEFGKWKDIRFTSPASPGNSGGPLVNIKGSVVGLIVKRNTNENHNIAVPINEFYKISNHAKFYVRNNSMYLNKEENTIAKDWDASFKLPLNIQELASKSQKSYAAFYKKLGNDLTDKYEKDYYPKGERFRAYLRDQQFIRQFGVLTSDADFNKWSLKNYYSKNISLKNNQKIILSKSDISSFHLVIEKPSGLSLLKFLDNQKLLMDNILKGLPITRSVGVEKIRMTSLGEPEKTDKWQDLLGRNWISSLWFIPHGNYFIYSHCLPYPKGQICNIDVKDTYELTFGYLYNIKIDYNEIAMGYEGSVSDWIEYLALDKKYLPKIFESSEMSLNQDGFEVNLPGYQVSLGSGEITKESSVHFHFGYSNHNLLDEHLLLFELFPRKGVRFHYRVQEYYSPTAFNSDKSKSSWEDLTKRSGDFTGEVINKGGNFSIKNVMGKVGSNFKKDFEVDSNYVVGCYKNSLSSDFKTKCDEFTKAVVFK